MKLCFHILAREFMTATTIDEIKNCGVTIEKIDVQNRKIIGHLRSQNQDFLVTLKNVYIELLED